MNLTLSKQKTMVASVEEDTNITDKTVEVELLRRYFGYKILGGLILPLNYMKSL